MNFRLETKNKNTGKIDKQIILFYFHNNFPRSYFSLTSVLADECPETNVYCSMSTEIVKEERKSENAWIAVSDVISSGG